MPPENGHGWSWRARWKAAQLVGLLLLAAGAVVHYYVVKQHGFQIWSFVLPALGAGIYVVARLGEWWARR
jgi:hypothetical protein